MSNHSSGQRSSYEEVGHMYRWCYYESQGEREELQEGKLDQWVGQYQITQIKEMRAEKVVDLGPEFINVLSEDQSQ